MPRNPLDTIPESLRPFFTITEVDDAEFFAGALFRRKFHASPPDFPRQLVACDRGDDGSPHPAGFSHMRPFGVYSGYFKDPDGHLWEIAYNAAAAGEQ